MVGGGETGKGSSSPALGVYGWVGEASRVRVGEDDDTEDADWGGRARASLNPPQPTPPTADNRRNDEEERSGWRPRQPPLSSPRILIHRR